MSKLIKTESYATLVHDIAELYNHAHHALVESYWQIGRRIVEQEQRGEANVVYIKQLIEQLSEDLSRQWDSGFSKRNLYKMRQFYLAHKLVGIVVSLRETCIRCGSFTWLTSLCRRRHS